MEDAPLDIARYKLAHLSVTTVDDLDTLDGCTILAGYHAGLNNQILPNGASRAFWHGWRNGQVDGGFARLDYEQAELARAYASQNAGPFSRVALSPQKG